MPSACPETAIGASEAIGLLFRVLPPPLAHHRRRDLFGIADWLRLGLHELMAPFAGTALGVTSQIGTDATSAVLRLAFQHDLLPDPRVENATTYRMRVPGGWLYRYQPNITSPPSSMVFVPDPASRD